MATEDALKVGLLWLLSLTVCAVAGVPLLHHGEFRRFALIARGLLAAAVGSVCLSWTMTLLALLGVRWHPVALVAIACLVGLCLRWLLANRVPSFPPRRLSGSVGASGALGTALGAGAVAIATLATRAGQTMSSDLLYFWGPKAQRFAEARTIDVEFLQNPLVDYIHPDYPPVLTNLYAFASMSAGRFSWWGAAALLPIFLAATGICVAAILGDQLSRRSASQYAGLTICALGVVTMETMVGGIGEMPLLFYEMLAVSLLTAARASTSAVLLLAGVCLAGAAGTKVEGLPFALAVSAFSVFGMQPPERRTQGLLFLLGPTVVTLGTWFLFGAKNGLFWFYKAYGSLLDIRWRNALPVGEEMLHTIAGVSYGLPFLLPAIIFLLTPGKTRAAALPIAASIALVGFLLVTYLSARGDPRQLINWSAPRVLSPVAGLLCVAAARTKLTA